ncbi:hypothetical protein FB567DRAFT_45798 [Paraphoma chrysanthemicola]|uniref:Rhodopsin domain-containing protein n=1 Tax=Paraphoma chrysanthemicola TaxID=798071 RepID=A0A8K0RLH3_9PLEO|nr:hypothetical protein FB567DRAFT_45798 [Paraphoma chrysanthemicola]
MGDLRPALLATNVVLIVLSLAAIACRIGRKVLLKRLFTWHDALIMLAALFATIFSSLLMASTRFGLGLPSREVSKSDLRIVLKLVMIYRVFYFLCNWMVKASLLLFYTTLTVDRGSRCFINVMQVVAFAFGMTCLFVTIFQCQPIHKVWDGASVPGKCASWPYFNYFNSCFMLATDVVLYAMPLVFVWHLRVSRPQLIAVNMLFALGGLCIAASSVRIYFVHEQSINPDFTRRNAMTVICAAVENHLAIIVACAPSIKVVLLHYLPSLKGDFERYPDSEIRTSDLNIMSINTQTEHDSLPKFAKPVIDRKTTDESSRTARTHDRKWWRPPTSWEVNREDTGDCDLENATRTHR